MKPQFQALLSIIVLLACQNSIAALGDRVTSIAIDRTALGATQKAVQKSAFGYTSHEMIANGNIVREYVSGDGIIFAVTWQGTKRPDLSVLLGAYFEEYSSEDAKAPKSAVSRQPLSIKTSDIIVQHTGHMRDLRGRAFIPSLVPEGVNVEVLP